MSYSNAHDIVLDASRILLEEASSIQSCAHRLQEQGSTAQQGFEAAIQLMFKSLDQGGKIIVTGVGKSGKIGEKIVATMLSTGTLASFMHPVEALHGDLGVIRPNDVVLAISYSGNTEELLALLPSLKRRQVAVVGLGGNPFSKLAKECQAWLDGQVDREAGDAMPAPTSSTTLALALGDALALTLAKLRSFDTDGFALNHPGGSLGRKLLMKVSDCMIPTALAGSVSLQAPLDVVIMEMTKHPKSSGVVVLCDDQFASDDSDCPFLWTPPASTIASDDEDEPSVLSTSSSTTSITSASALATRLHKRQVLGVITNGDVHRILKSIDKDHNVFSLRAADIMTKSPITCSPDSLALDALRAMQNTIPDYSLPLLPVITHHGRWLGVVTRKDLQEFF